MEATCKIIPKIDLIKQKLKIPLQAIIAPTRDDDFSNINCNQKDLIICSSCGSYLNSKCSSEEQNWICSICGHKNHSKDGEIFIKQQQTDKIEIELNSIPDPGSINVIFYSTDIPKPYSIAAKLFIMGMLRGLKKNSRLLIFVGNSRSPFTLLVPPHQSQPFERSETTGPFETDSIPPISKAASIVHFPSAESFIGLDLSRFFFNSDTAATAERAIEKILETSGTTTPENLCQLAGTLCKVVEYTPIHFVAIVDKLNRIPTVLERLYPSVLRFDFVIAQFNEKAFETCSKTPGFIRPLSTSNPVRQGKRLIQEKNVYQLLSRVISKKSGVEWKKAARPFSDTKDNLIYCPCCLQTTPFILSLNPLQNQSEITFQIISKYKCWRNEATKFIMRVETLTLPTNDDLPTIKQNIDFKAVFWSWQRLVADRAPSEAVAIVLRAAVAASKECPEILPFAEHIPSSLVYSKDLAVRSIALDILSSAGPHVKIDELPIYTECVPSNDTTKGKELLAKLLK